MSRELNEDEVRENFLDNCYQIINYWENVDAISIHDRLFGVVFSILVSLDGESVNLPRFIVAPNPHPDYKEYNQIINKNWYPQNYKRIVDCDIGGLLHDTFVLMNKKTLEMIIGK